MTANDQPSALLAPALARSPEHHWEGVFDVTSGADEGDLFHVKARIGFHGELVEGVGHAFDEDGRGGGRDFVLSGANAAGGLAFQIWLEAEDYSHLPFDCTGVLDAEGAAMDGCWAIPCLDSVGCGCGGAGGTFRLRRVPD